MNAPLSLSARAMDWRIDPWRALRVEPRKEAFVVSRLTSVSSATFLPVDVQAKSKRPVPLLPCVVFARLELYVLSTIHTDIKQITGYFKDAEDFPQAIPDRQMDEFFSAYQKLSDDIRAKLALGHALGRAEKAKWKDLKDGLAELLNRMETK